MIKRGLKQCRGTAYRVADVAQFSGVSVRTLHHYDSIGLLRPTGGKAGRSDAGYRLYDDNNLLRLQQILVARALGLSLHQIRRLLDDPAFDYAAALKVQRGRLAARIAETHAMIRALDRTLAMLDADKNGKPLVGKWDMSKIFSGFDPAQYQAEAERRWGMTDAYKESAKRAQSYGPQDWHAIQVAQEQIYSAAMQAMAAGREAGDAEVMEIADAHRRFIDRWFYPCTFTLHRGLADMYEADPRFSENIDKHGESLTPFLAAAIRANAARYNA